MSKEQQKSLFDSFDDESLDKSPHDDVAADEGNGVSTADMGDHIPAHERHGPLTDMVDHNFLEYASYVICERAIPNLADGLKPVQRRIMHSLQEKDDGRFIKVANVVGHSMQYHPHGDASIGDALVNLTNKRYLIEGQGNFGNIFTGDGAAASRYIECRLTELARQELFNKRLTDTIASYDGRNREPVTLPSKLPLLLMLGAEGIAVGLSTSILPHNFIELLRAQIEIIHETKKSPAKLNVLPDFQTGGMMDVGEYNKGFGRIKVRARINKVGDHKLLITELPCGQTTELVIRSIEDAVKKKKVPVKTINDFTAEKVEIEIVLSPDSNHDKAIQKLYAFTKCETTLSSSIVVISNGRPVEMNTSQVLRTNVKQLLSILKRELNLRKHDLLEEFHSKSLIQIFVENRIYKKIEECKTYSAVVDAVAKGLEPFRGQLKRDISKKDIEMLLGVRIKRISRFDINKNRKDIEAILSELEKVEKHLSNIKSYAVKYLKKLINNYGPVYPRCTSIETFKAPDKRKLTANELTINLDTEKGFLGYNAKGDPKLQCSSLDKLLILKNDGTFVVMPPPETYYVDDKLLWCGFYNRDLEFMAVYSEWGVTHIKRFKVGGVIMNSDYAYIPKNAKLLLFCADLPQKLYVKYTATKRQRISQQTFDPGQVRVKSLKANGIQLTSKEVARIGTKPGRWWDKKIKSPQGILL
ncbi:MAG: DNA topoisomerase IV subunit A [Anaerohalosphaera sp.]|nr:DNA topoisomerase IV subunit A [Anaerohalosphaera sp.]